MRYAYMHITVNFIILWTESLKSCQSLGLCGLFISSLKVKSLSCVQLFVTPWTVAYQVLPSMGFPRQEYWSELPFPSPGVSPDPGIEPRSPALQADSLPLSHQGCYVHKKADPLPSSNTTFGAGGWKQ